VFLFFNQSHEQVFSEMRLGKCSIQLLVVFLSLFGGGQIKTEKLSHFSYD